MLHAISAISAGLSTYTIDWRTSTFIYIWGKDIILREGFVQGDSTVMTTCIGAHITVIQSPRVYTFQLI